MLDYYRYLTECKDVSDICLTQRKEDGQKSRKRGFSTAKKCQNLITSTERMCIYKALVRLQLEYASAKTKQVIWKAKMDHESSIISDLKSNPKRLHKYIRQKQKIKHSIGPLKKPDGSITITSEESAKALACFFHS